MKFICTAHLALCLAKVWKDVLPAPARVPKPFPRVKIFVLATDADQPVDRAASAKHFAPWLINASALSRRLRLRLVEPIDRAILKQSSVAQRNMYPQVIVRRPRLDQ